MIRKTLKKLTALCLLLLLCLAQTGQAPAYAETEAAASERGGEDLTGNGAASQDLPEAETSETETVQAAVWPYMSASIEAGSAIVMDADTHQILWGKEIHTKRYPASVTKLLTALVVLDNCSLDETVTFSATAVNNLESGAVTIGTVEGDTLSVKDCLYALLLKSANEVANALAEHVAGSQEAFAEMMNAKAVSLGCTDSDFRNPSGLTDSEHVTSAHDMALIGCACMNNSTFLALESEPTRKLGGTKNYPDGLTVTIGHKMRVSGEQYYDARVIAGKTGYTSASGNTLVTMAEDNGRRVVVVVLKDKSPAHYTDTASLLNYGLNEFELLKPDQATLLETLDVEQTLVEKGVIPAADEVTGAYNELKLSDAPVLTVPLGAGLSDLHLTYDTTLDAAAPEGAVAKLTPSCLDSAGPSFYVLHTRIETESENGEVLLETGERKNGDESSGGNKSNGMSMLAWILLALLLTVLLFAAYLYIRKRKEEKRRAERRRIRRERMERLDSCQREAAGERERRERSRRVSTGIERRTERPGQTMGNRQFRTPSGGISRRRNHGAAGYGNDPARQNRNRTENIETEDL